MSTGLCMSASIPPAALKRLRSELKQLLAEPMDGIVARPNPSNILEWFYVLDGAKDSPFTGGEYFGSLVFPSTYPFSPPALYMYTPSGCFAPEHRVCMSMTDYHPESWSPGWSIRALLVALQSFMCDPACSLQSLSTSTREKRVHAKESWELNRKDKRFCEYFSERVEMKRVEEIDEKNVTVEDGELRRRGNVVTQEGDTASGAGSKSVEPVATTEEPFQTLIDGSAKRRECMEKYFYRMWLTIFGLILLLILKNKLFG